MRKGELACNKQFLLFSQCFLPDRTHTFHFKRTLKCRLQFVSIWTSLKILLSGNGLNRDEAMHVSGNTSPPEIIIYWWLPIPDEPKEANEQVLIRNSPNGDICLLQVLRTKSLTKTKLNTCKIRTKNAWTIGQYHYHLAQKNSPWRNYRVLYLNRDEAMHEGICLP